MTRSAPRSRARSGAQSALLSILVVALLVPVGALFAQTWRAEGDRADATQRELDGVAYLRTLQQVAFAVADAQSAAVAGQPARRDALAVAVQQADATDARLGATLRTTERWTGIRSRLETLRSAPTGDNPLETLADYREVGDLVLALYAKVRDESGLVHDPDGDAFHLQNSAAGELPVAVISAGRLADVALLAAAASAPATPGRPKLQLTPDQQTQLLSQLVAERVTLVDASTRLIDDLRSAVDSTESRTLGSNLLSRLDRYQRTADIIAVGFAQPRTSSSSGDPSMITVLRGQLQAAAGELSSTIFNEVERLLNTRADAIDRERMLAGGAVLLAVLLAIGFFLALFLGGRPRAARPTGPFPERDPATPPPDDATAWPTVTPIASAPQDNQSQWERSGAAR
ncbi:hypothetical protein [Asanoa iriomotensis]|uniref:Nitrate/nitrite sensing protein n=1 Tax=Asanoa iriomotensis TaxID=234613 RepID=A0ABQ4C282_9ACTN|nr:hypothetical protein [Asanoa iriomotensis]GIF56896.1 hypothetical protein Air01nite_29910 [Asanoa iriomotensis]